VRASGPGTLESTGAFAGPYLANGRGDGFDPSAGVSVPVAERQSWVYPGHGPSDESSFVFRFAGDVQVEQVTVWTIGGKAAR
jgi:hypothetical protein